jgi:dTDP-4-amino-4,6-dideoxygalactose transaminase
MNRSTKFIPFARPSLGAEEEEAALRVIRSGWLTSGKEARAFEQEFADEVGSKHALAVNSATSGLHIAALAVGIGPGSRVAVPTYTFTSTAAVIVHAGAVPVLVDVDPETLNIDLEAVRTACEHGRVDAVIPVHMAGLGASMEGLLALSRNYGFSVIEDAAHAFPCPTEYGHLGTIGSVGVYSFYANKTITTGEGGMVVTDDDDTAKRLQRLRLHGFDRDAWDRYTSRTASWAYRVVEAGFKYNLPDLSAAIGRVQLKRAYAMRDRRAQIAAFYHESLADADFLRLPRWADSHSWHLYIVQLDPARLSITRAEFIEALAERGVGSSVHYVPLHLMPYYQEAFGYAAGDFPQAERAAERVVSLPIYPDLTDEDLAFIVESVLDVGSRNQPS